ncbi:MAG TPA: hypothetical protein DCQ31_11095, partial [Bacteroidales bacterium]|nr:hypothetical protein [Bacteroidales bacterium]
GVLEYVNPFIGTGGHGHTYPGASLPFGMVQLSPDTRLEGWDGCSGYHYTDSVIFGFSHTHLSGTGIADYADVLLMPSGGKIKFDNGYQKPRFSGYSSLFAKETEKAEAGWYSVNLQDYNIDVELTATLRAGFHKYTFNQPDSAHIILDLMHRDQVIESYIKIVSDTEIEGFRRSKEWAQDQYVYFVAQFSEPIASFILKNGDKESSDVKEISGTKLKAAFSFNLKEKNEVLVKVGISAVDAAGARNNLNTEIVDWDFNKTKEAAQNTWKESLSRFEVEGGTDDQKTIFYT